MSDTKNVLHEKLDEFIRKYYLNRLLQGLLLGLGGLLAFFILASVIEYFGRFGSVTRGILFFGYITFALFVLARFIVIPLMKWMGVGKIIDYHEASGLIGKHFPEISDKLLNTLQLQEQSGNSDNELLIASVNQRIKNLSPFRFSTAIDLKNSTKKYGKYTLLPLSLLLIILIFQSNMITKPVRRILSYDQQFAKEAPFEFVLKTKELEVVKNSDMVLEIETKGKDLPANVFVNMDKHLIKMEKTGKNTFSYSMPNLTADHHFFFSDGEYNSAEYDIKVLPNPTLVNFAAHLTYPSYINKKKETIQNIGDLTVPAGTEIEWVFNTKDADRIDFQIEGKSIGTTKSGDHFSIRQTIRKSADYFLQLHNAFVKKQDTIKYALQVIPDRFPGIAAEQQQDSINPFIYYFYGKADDDYGISRLSFVYRNTTGTEGVLKYLPVNIGKSTDEIFYYMIDLKTLIRNDGDAFEYYFEVWDNDAVNGKKSSKSQVFKAISPDQDELRADAENSSKSIKSKMQEAMKEIQTLQKKTNELNKELMEGDNLDWQQQQKLKDFVAEQKKLEAKVEQLKNENKAKNEKEKQLQQEDKELIEKQKELEKLFNEIMTPEMKELLKKLEEMMKNQNKEAIQKQLEKMKMNNEDMKKQLDRTLEQYKQLELEKNINEQVNELNKLSEQQEELQKKTLEKSESQEELQKQQEEINKKFEDIQKRIDEIEKKNEELETPMKLDDTKKEEEQIKEGLEESSKSIEKKQNKKASESQKKSADEMKEMAEKMKKSLEKSQEQQQEEDYYTLRQILENLIELSDQQEALMQQMRETKSYSPKFVELSAKQRKLKENAQMVEDSLLALSKRQVQIQGFINKEITNINHYMDKSINHFSKVEISTGVAQQQYVMTGLNNLAVMLSESLKKMQEDLSEKKKKGNSQCNNPGKKPGKPGKSGKPKMGGIKKMQDEINKQLQEMKQGKQQGQTPGSEQFARIAAQQEALRREMEKLEKMLREEGKPGALGDMEKTRKLMEQQEKDLVNKQLNPETMKRMQEIETRLLEHEKAEREQNQDTDREAEKAKEINNEMPPAIKAYLEKKAREMELLRSVPSELSPYYKDRVRVYFKKVGNG